MINKKWFIGTAAVAMVLATAFGISSVKAADTAKNAAENLVYEEVKSYESGGIMCSTSYTWVGDDNEYTVIDKDGNMTTVDNTDGKYGTIGFVSSYSPDGYIQACYDEGEKLYNLDGSEAFGGTMHSGDVSIRTVDGKKYAVWRTGRGNAVVEDEDGNDISAKFYADGMNFLGFYETGDYVAVSYYRLAYVDENNNNVSGTKLYKIFDKEFNLTDKAVVTDGRPIGQVRATSDNNYYMVTYQNVAANGTGAYLDSYKVYDREFNEVTKLRVDGYDLIGLTEYKNYYVAQYTIWNESNRQYYYKFYTKDLSPYSSQQPVVWADTDKPADYNEYVTKAYEGGHIFTEQIEEKNFDFDDGYELYDGGASYNAGTLKGYKVYLGMKESDKKITTTTGNVTSTTAGYSIALFDENGTKLVDLGTPAWFYCSGGSRGDKLIVMDYDTETKNENVKILKVSTKEEAEKSGVFIENGQIYVYENGNRLTDYTGMAADADGNRYWFDNGTAACDKQVYSPADDAWYWFDANGTMAVGKDVFVPKSNEDRSQGKWVRYDENGHMVKGEDYANGGWYRFDETTGEMAKGFYSVEDDDTTKLYYYNEATGIMEHGALNIDGTEYAFDDVTGVAVNKAWYSVDGAPYWYENGIRQGMEGRGKEIYDAASDGWYWLDAVDGGKKAVSKDVYQESYAGAYADREDGTGKWVRYDENGRMIKGWSQQNGATYYFDPVTGAMAKGTTVIDGTAYTFSWTTGALQ